MLLFGVDSFTDKAFHGNPAAVCVTEEPLADELMQKLAAEMNLSETAFVSAADNFRRLRWFTPTQEVNLCGHATLAAAHVLFSQALIPQESFSFQSRSGELRIQPLEDGRIRLDFPKLPAEPAEASQELLDEFGPAVAFAKSTEDVVLELQNEADVLRAVPNMWVIAQNSARGLIVTAKTKANGAHGEYDFISRFFGPNVGVDEDPVTGSAHCVLATYWQQKLGKDSFKAYQASERGGEIQVDIREERVLLSGQAVIVYEGKFRL